MSATPPFVRWTLPLACALRDDTDVTNPEQTERQLRSLRTYSDCIHAGREFEGVCVSAQDPQLGFPSQEVLQAYGGEEFVHAQCNHCVVNVLRGRAGSGLAGCFGQLVMDDQRYAEFEAAIDRAGSGEAIAQHFLPTTPRWYGLWTQAALNANQIAIMQQLFAAMEDATSEEREFQQALALATTLSMPLYVRANPAGEVLPDGWRVNAHCGRCKAPMDERSRYCSVCQLQAHAEPSRHRKARGSRPYVPLARFLGAAGAQAFAERYAARSAACDNRA